jgi:hypothetical protein
MKLVLQDCFGSVLFLQISNTTTFSSVFNAWRNFTGELVPYLFHNNNYFYREKVWSWIVSEHFSNSTNIQVPMKIPPGGTNGMPIGVKSGFSLNPFKEFA